VAAVAAAVAERERAVRALLHKDLTKALQTALASPPLSVKESSAKVCVCACIVHADHILLTNATTDASDATDAASRCCPALL
jgi:hypothetical protein